MPFFQEKYLPFTRKQNEYYISIQPWGGEPLLEADKIFHIREKLNRDASDLNVNISLETNGSLITDEIARKLKELNIGVGISLDGPEYIHNRQRINRKGEPTFSDVMNAIRCLQRNQLSHIGTLSVITKNSLPHLDEILAFFAETLPECSVKINPMHSPGKEDAKSDAITAQDISLMQKTLVESICRLWREGKKVHEANITTALRNLLIRYPKDICKSHGCTGGKTMVIFNQKGQCFPCEMVDYPSEQLGNVFDSDDIGEQINRSMPNKEYFHEKGKPECQTCPWWYYCQGGCTSAIFYAKGQVSGVDEMGCAGTKALYESLVQLLLEDTSLALEIANLPEPIFEGEPG